MLGVSNLVQMYGSFERFPPKINALFGFAPLKVPCLGWCQIMTPERCFGFLFVFDILGPVKTLQLVGNNHHYFEKGPLGNIHGIHC